MAVNVENLKTDMLRVFHGNVTVGAPDVAPTDIIPATTLRPRMTTSIGGFTFYSGAYLITGAPRAGKSTLLRAILAQACKEKLGDAAYAVPLFFDPMGGSANEAREVLVPNGEPKLLAPLDEDAISAVYQSVGLTPVLEPGAVGYRSDDSGIRSLFLNHEPSQAIGMMLASKTCPALWMIDSLTLVLTTLGVDLLGSTPDTAYPKGLRKSEILAALSLDLLAQAAGKTVLFTLNSGLFPAAAQLDGTTRGFMELVDSSWVHSGVAISSRAAGRTYAPLALSSEAVELAFAANVFENSELSFEDAMAASALTHNSTGGRANTASFSDSVLE